MMNGKPVMLLTRADLDEGDDLTLDQAAQRVLARMESQRFASSTIPAGWCFPELKRWRDCWF